MTNALNKTIIEGRVVRVPQLKQTGNGIAYCYLTLAVNETYCIAGQTKKTVSFITVALWNKTAVACNTYLQKGQWVRVEGKLRQSIWADNNGMRHSKVAVNCDSIEFLLRDQKKSLKTETKDIKEAEQTESVQF
jgi:single-strand DNA-binding protein